MRKQLKDYVHLYIGAPVRIRNKITGHWSNWRKLTFSDCVLIVGYDHVAELALRRLNTMTHDEFEQCDLNKEMRDNRVFYADDVPYLLSQHFDLFDLIPNKLAVDRATL